MLQLKCKTTIMPEILAADIGENTLQYMYQCTYSQTLTIKINHFDYKCRRGNWVNDVTVKNLTINKPSC